MTHSEVSKTILLDGAQMNLAALTAGIAGFLKAKKIPFKEFIAYLGDTFEGSFDDFEGRGTDEVMEHLLALEILPMGTSVAHRKMGANRSEVTLSALPPPEVLEKFGTSPEDFLGGFGVTPQEYETVFAMYEPAAKAIGMKFSHHLKDGQEVISLEKTA